MNIDRTGTEICACDIGKENITFVFEQVPLIVSCFLFSQKLHFYDHVQETNCQLLQKHRLLAQALQFRVYCIHSSLTVIFRENSQNECRNFRPFLALSTLHLYRENQALKLLPTSARCMKSANCMQNAC